MKNLNLYGRRELNDAITTFATKVYLRELLLETLGADVKALKKEVSDLENSKGRNTVGFDTYFEGRKEALSVAESKLSEALKKEEVTFKWDEKDLALRKAWAKTPKGTAGRDARVALLANWCKAWGVPVEGDACRDLDYELYHPSKTRVKKWWAEGVTTKTGTLNLSILYAILFEQVMDLGIMKQNLVPEELLWIWLREEVDSASRREQKKAEKARKAAEKKARKEAEKAIIASRSQK